MDSSLSEEAFLLCSLHEVLKIWSNGSGKASFNLDICDGSADLKLSFKLGAPSDIHYQPGGVHVNHQQQSQEYHEHFHENPQKQKWRRKGPARREKDRARAAAYQARYQPKAAAPVGAKLYAAAPAVIKLPFDGNILPIKKNPDSSVESSTNVSPQASSSSAEAASAPVKASQAFSNAALENIENVKQQLFVSTVQLPHSSPLSREIISSNIRGYQQKEEELWTKLFKS